MAETETVMDDRSRSEHAASDDLLRAVAAQDRQAFSQLYDLMAPRLYAVTCKILGSEAEADEALQETFVKTWRHADQWPGDKGTSLTWLLAIARHTAIDQRRAARRRERHMDGIVVSEVILPLLSPRRRHTPEEAVGHSSDAAQLSDCLDDLPGERAEVIRKAYFTGDSYAEIAAETGRPEGTLKSWVHRSLAALRRCLEERGVGGAV